MDNAIRLLLEENILAQVLEGGDASALLHWLKPSNFSRTENKHIMEAIEALHPHNPISVLSVGQWLYRQGKNVPYHYIAGLYPYRSESFMWLVLQLLELCFADEAMRIFSSGFNTECDEFCRTKIADLLGNADVFDTVRTAAEEAAEKNYPLYPALEALQKQIHARVQTVGKQTHVQTLTDHLMRYGKTLAWRERHAVKLLGEAIVTIIAKGLEPETKEILIKVEN